jgi:hypothetical protein
LLPVPTLHSRGHSTASNSPSSSVNSPKGKGKASPKLPGRTLIRLLRSSNPLGQTAAGTGLTRAQKAAIVFPPFIIEVFTGMLLGDCGLRMMGNDAHIYFEQKDQSFVVHLWSLFNEIGIVGAPPLKKESIIKPSGNGGRTVPGLIRVRLLRSSNPLGQTAAGRA